MLMSMGWLCQGKFYRETPMNFMGKFVKISVRGSIFPDTNPLGTSLHGITLGGAPVR